MDILRQRPDRDIIKKPPRRSDDMLINPWTLFRYLVKSLEKRNDQKSLTTHETKQEHFKALVSQTTTPFLIERTNRFVNEVELFLALGLNIEAYDKVYMQHLGWKVSGITTEGEVSGNAPLVPYLFLFDD